jgi:hypothetical protein
MIRFSNPQGLSSCQKKDLPSSLDFSLERKSGDIFSVPPACSFPEAGRAPQGRKSRYDARMNFQLSQRFFGKDGAGKNPFLLGLGRTIG